MPSRPAHQQAEWNIMVFLNAKNNLEPFSFANFAQMASVGSTAKVNILVEYGRPQHHYSTQFGAWTKTLRFRIKKGMTPTEANALEDLGRTNMGDGAALTDFVTWARQKFPAKRDMLVIWDHGQGWRVMTATTVPNEHRDQFRALRRDLRRHGTPGRMQALTVPDDMRIHGGIRYVSLDDDTGDKLYNRKIQDALTGLTKTRKVDIIGFDACLMAMLETGYALRNVGTVMVASEELEPGTGWNYTRWLKPLVDDPAGFDAVKLGKLMVQGYRETYGNHDDTTMSAVTLSGIAGVAKAVSAFADRARTKLTGQLTALKRARAACANYAPGYGLHSIDLGRFLTQLRNGASVDPGLRQAADVAVTAIQKSLLANYASASRQAKFGSAGMAIYFPISKFAYDQDPDRKGYDLTNTVYPVEFVQKETWAPFLHAYLNRVRS